MICESCQIRSSIGFCASCKRMVCDGCAEVCDSCGKLSCKEHAYDGGGMVYCRACGEEAGARPRSREAAYVGREEEAPRVRRPYENPPAWLVAAVLAGLSAVFTGLLYVHPDLVRLPLPGGVSLPISLATPLVPLAAMGWAIGGLRETRVPRKPFVCLASLLVSIVAIAGAWAAFYRETFGG